MPTLDLTWLRISRRSLAIWGGCFLFVFGPAAALVMSFDDPAIPAASLARIEAERANTRPLPWPLLAAGPGAELRSLDGQSVRIAGCMMLIEEEDEEARMVSEFLLVPNPGACGRLPAPVGVQTIYVRMQGSELAPVQWWNPVELEGRFEIDAPASPGMPPRYRVTARRIYPLAG